MTVTDNPERPWESQTAAQMRAYAESAGIDLSHLPSKAAKREIWTALMQGLAAKATAAVAEVDEALELTAQELIAEHTGNADELTAEDRAALRDVDAMIDPLTDAEKAAAYDRAILIGSLIHQRDEDEVDEVMRRWKTPDEDDVDVAEAARDRVPYGSLLPTKAQWTQIEVMGDTLAEGRLVKAKQLATPADVKLILLAARDLGIPPTMALQQIHVIDGKPSLSAQLMVALVRNAGFSITPKLMTAESAVAVGKRGDEVVESEFTWQEAEQAGLVGKDNYKHYPKAMLWSRAVSGLCRVLFPDVLAGLTYTPEELTDGDWSDDVPPMQQVESTSEVVGDPALDDLAKAGILAKITALPPENRDALKVEWGALQEARQVRGLSVLRQSDLPVVTALLDKHKPAPDTAEPPCEQNGGGSPTQDVYADQTAEVRSPLLNDPEDEPHGQPVSAAAPEEAVVICSDCGAEAGTNTECFTCMEEPF